MPILRAQIHLLVESCVDSMLAALRTATLLESGAELRSRQPGSSRSPDKTTGAPRPSNRPRRRKMGRSRNPERHARLVKRALEWQGQLDKGEVPTQAAIARREGLSRARVTQIMSALRNRA